jgi:parallel beta-helix repeat protein
MTDLSKNFTTLTTVILLFLSIGLMSYGQQQQHLHFVAEAGEGFCTEYDQMENTISVNCNTSFSDVARAVNDPKIMASLGNGEYILNATLEIADDITFEMNSSNPDDNLQYLKIANENGIIVYGKLLIDGIKITSWNTSSNDVIPQDINGTIRRGYIQFAASEGSQIINSEFGYLGDVEPGRRGFDLLDDGDGEPSHDMVIRGNKFHDMWFAFYSREAYNIIVDSNEYYKNIKYALDPHTVTHDMVISNNWLHHNPIGVICSNRCYNIVIEGNVVEHNKDYGIFFSRNVHDSIARDNHVYNSSTGVMVSESPNNQIYNNTIQGATSQGIYLFNPELPDDGVTEGNIIYNNTIINSENGIVAARSHDNIVQNATFFNIEESEYRLSEDSSIILKGQHFDNAIISQDSSVTTIRQ